MTAPTAVSIRAAEQILNNQHIIIACDDRPIEVIARLIDAAGMAEAVEMLKLLTNATADTLATHHRQTQCCGVTRQAVDDARALHAKLTT